MTKFVKNKIGVPRDFQFFFSVSSPSLKVFVVFRRKLAVFSTFERLFGFCSPKLQTSSGQVSVMLKWWGSMPQSILSLFQAGGVVFSLDFLGGQRIKYVGHKNPLQTVVTGMNFSNSFFFASLSGYYPDCTMTQTFFGFKDAS